MPSFCLKQQAPAVVHVGRVEAKADGLGGEKVCLGNPAVPRLEPGLRTESEMLES